MDFYVDFWGVSLGKTSRKKSTERSTKNPCQEHFLTEIDSGKFCLDSLHPFLLRFSLSGFARILRKTSFLPIFCQFSLGTSPPLTGVSQALRPEMPKSLENVSQGLWLGSPKSLQKVRKKSKTLSRHFPETLRRLPRLSPRLFGDFFGSPGRRPRETFSRVFGISGPEGPRDPCKGRAGSQNFHRL